MNLQRRKICLFRGKNSVGSYCRCIALNSLLNSCEKKLILEDMRTEKNSYILSCTCTHFELVPIGHYEHGLEKIYKAVQSNYNIEALHLKQVGTSCIFNWC